ncbi:MAG TPA: SRPBCC domain-containing protein [Phycisphaerales bacterium]|nr:SRPBCC domain-containing protein [Phycisphaerales bacterium]
MTTSVKNIAPPADTQSQTQTLHIQKEIEIDAPIAIAFAAVLEELGPGSHMPDGAPSHMKLEAWPGGRLFRDLGNNTGHFWGHVQVIKPPTLLEISGPLFMSYPAVNFVQYRLTAAGERTTLLLTHRAVGLLTPEHREGVQKGWDHGLGRIAQTASVKVHSKIGHKG